MAAKVKKALAPELKVTSAEVQMIDLSKVVSNTAQSRGMGVLPTLQEEGWGLFDVIQDDKEPIWDMLLSPKPEDRQQGILLVEEHEPEIVELEKSTASVQLQPIGVFEVDGEYDVIFGMRRAIAEALRCARNGRTVEIEAKVFEFDRKPSQADLLFMAMKENCDRREEGILDRAVTYRRLEKQEGYTPEQIGKMIGKSDQYVRNYVKMLDPLLEKYRPKIQDGRLRVDPALKILKKLKEGKKGGAREETNGDTRYRLPSVKKIQQIYEAERKPGKMDQDEWDLWIDPKVREFLAFKLGFTYTPFVEKELPPEKGESEEKKDSGVVFKIKRERAKRLLIALGKPDARNFKDDKLKEKLENIVSVAEDGQKVETEALQVLLDKLQAAYKDGYTVTIVDDKKKD